MNNKISIGEIYKTVVDLEGPKYPLDNMDALNDAADYILNKLKSYGIETEDQEFYVKGMKEPFRNIIGYIGDKTKPAIVLGSHYDTVRDCPGANDNLSAVAVTLEIARVLSKMNNPPTVIVSAFTLEEKHPGMNKAVEQELINSGIHDKYHRFTSPQMLKFNKRIKGLVFQKIRQLTKYNLIYREILEELKDTLAYEEINYLNILIDVFDEFKSEYTNGNLTYSIGSQEFVKKIQKENIKISNIINYDCLGWISNDVGTQKLLPLGKEIQPFVKLHKVELDKTIGNFIGVMGDKNSQPILNEFLKNCENIDVDIPYFGVNIPMDYENIKKYMMDTLRSDHAPFWQAGIPGIFISDTANFRSNYYHTGASLKTILSYKY
jgi:hypothetical protein